jgi:hypothetical protein
MGLRSWLTEVNTKQDLLNLIDLANNVHLGVNYVLQIEKKHPYFKLGSVIVAWSGDGNSSIEDLPSIGINLDSSCNLEYILERYPNWHSEKEGPGKFGLFLNKEDIIKFEFNNTTITKIIQKEESKMKTESKLDIRMISEISTFLGEGKIHIQDNIVSWTLFFPKGVGEVELDFERKELIIVDWNGNSKTYYALVGRALTSKFEVIDATYK